MAKVLLVSYAGYPYTPSSLMPDNGLAALAGALIEAGHEVRIHDYCTVNTIRRLYPAGLSESVVPLARELFVGRGALSVWQKLRMFWYGYRLERHQEREAGRIAEEVAEEAADYGAEVVGLKLWNGDGFTGSKGIARAVHDRLPRARVVAGGPHVDYFGSYILEHTGVFDILVSGEGERVFPRLVSAICSGGQWHDLSGLIWREGGEIRENPTVPIEELDELPLPVYEEEVYPALAGDEKIKIGVVDESRGCPNRCSFCIHPQKSGGKWALKSGPRVIGELRELMQRLGTRYFIYSGSNTPAETAVSIAREILEQGLDVRYGCFGHVRGIARADFELLRESGCRAIFYGLESASPRILKEGLNKPINIEKAEQVLRQTKEAGICTITSIIFPCPFEDQKSRRETMDFLDRVRPDSVPVTIPGMIPGTPWQKNPARFGFEMNSREDMLERALTYKIKLLYPPSLWKPLPYGLNGKSSKEIFAESEAFSDELEEAGLVTNVPHEMALMADILGCADDLRGFRDSCRAAFLSGDISRITDMVYRINQNVTDCGEDLVRAAEAVPRGVG